MYDCKHHNALSPVANFMFPASGSQKNRYQDSPSTVLLFA